MEESTIKQVIDCKEHLDTLTVGSIANGVNVVLKSDIKLWQPKLGEWCWYKHLLVKVISIDKRDDGIIRYVISAPMYAEQYSGAILLEPFIGELPSFLKDNK